jgi:superfamily II DNA/RNA helicase
VFLSTDAGGVGLNLQAASAVVNFEPPWNPARLEQRIGRVHRMGQSRPVQVIHLLTTGSIEERVWETLRLKKSLFASVFDSPAAEVSFAALGRKSVLQAVKEVFTGEPATKPAAAKPLLESAAPSQDDGVEQAAAGLLEAGLQFLEALARKPRSDEGINDAIERGVSQLIGRDPQTNRQTLSIPLPGTITGARLGRAIAGLLGGLGTPPQST